MMMMMMVMMMMGMMGMKPFARNNTNSGVILCEDNIHNTMQDVSQQIAGVPGRPIVTHVTITRIIIKYESTLQL